MTSLNSRTMTLQLIVLLMLNLPELMEMLPTFWPPQRTLLKPLRAHTLCQMMSLRRRRRR